MSRPRGIKARVPTDQGARHLTIVEWRAMEPLTDEEKYGVIMEEIAKANNIYCFYKYQQAKLIL